MYSMFIKMFLLAISIILIIKSEKFENHSYLIMFLISYIAYLAFDIKYKIDFLKGK